MFYRKRRPQYLCWKPLSFQKELLLGSFKKQPLALLPVGVFIKGNTQLVHSEMYRGTSNKKLIASTYNGLGTNQITACIRVQAGNAKLIYDIAKTNRYRILSHLRSQTRTSSEGNFNDTTGKILATRITIQQIRLFKTQVILESKTDAQ